MTDRLTDMTTENTAKTISELLVELIETMGKDLAELHAQNEELLREFSEGAEK